MLKILNYSLILLFIICSAANADVLPEGKKKISFYFTVSGIDKFTDYVFLAYPVNSSGGVPQNECIILEESKTVYLSCKYNSPSIYAIKKELFNPDDIKTENIGIENPKLDSFFAYNKNIVGTKEIGCEAFADLKADYVGITDYYNIESVNNDSLIIKKIKSIKKTIRDNKIKGEGNIYDGNENINTAGYFYYSLPFLSLIAFVTFVFIRKRSS